MAGKKKATKDTSNKRTESVAKAADGTVQINFTIPWKQIQKGLEANAEEMGKSITVPGFRKGKAPIERVIDQIPRDELVERTLGEILPQLFGEAVKENKLKPIMYPRFEIVSAEDEKDWQIRAVTCEVVEFELGDYKKQIQGALRAETIWTPDKAKAEPSTKDGEKAMTREEKEQIVITELGKIFKFDLPAILVDQEVESKLSSLLQRLEKLGLSLEAYLGSIKKTPEKLREEYRAQAEGALRLEIILSEIAMKEKIAVTESELAETLKAAAGDPKLAEKLDTPEQRATISAVMRKRKVIDMLVGLG